MNQHATQRNSPSFLLFSLFLILNLLTIPVISVPNAQTTPHNMNDIITALCQILLLQQGSSLSTAIEHWSIRNQLPVPHGSLPITDSHILNIDHNDAHLLAGHEVPSGAVTLAALGICRRLEQGHALFKGVVLEVLLDVELLLGRANGGYPRGATYRRADAGHGGCVEVEEQGGEAGSGFGAGGSAGETAALGWRTVRDPWGQ